MTSVTLPTSLLRLGYSASLGLRKSNFLEARKALKRNRTKTYSAFKTLLWPNTNARNHRTSANTNTNRILPIAFIKLVPHPHHRHLDTQALVHTHIALAHHPLLFQGSVMQNGYSNIDETVAEIKERAKERAFSVTKTKLISATSLMRVAQEVALDAQKAEDSGDLKKSLGLWVQASSLIHALLETADFKAEAPLGKRGAIYKEVTEWMQVSTFIVLRFELPRSRDPYSTSRTTRRVSSTRRPTLNPS